MKSGKADHEVHKHPYALTSKMKTGNSLLEEMGLPEGTRVEMRFALTILSSIQKLNQLILQKKNQPVSDICQDGSR